MVGFANICKSSSGVEVGYNKNIKEAAGDTVPYARKRWV
jgi:hypothetical protein